jgi:DNA-binding beta-propeller fold protein YncE
MTHGPGLFGLKRVLLPLFLTCAFAGSLVVNDASALETRAVQHLFDLTQAANSPLSLPSDVAVAADGRIYVVDGNNDRVAVYAADGKFLATIGSTGSADGQFSAPIGIDVDTQGDIYVADSGNFRLQVFDAAGKFVRQIPLREKQVRIKPVDVAVDTRKQVLYVTGNTNHKVMLYSLSGKYLGAWGQQGNNPGEFRFPATITVANDGLIYVVDVLNSRVQIFERNGKVLTVAGSWGVLPGQLFRPKGVAVDATGAIYVSDSYLGLIEVFDNTKQFAYVLGEDNAPHKFITPTGITLDKQQRIYVTEMLGNKVSVYKLK